MDGGITPANVKNGFMFFKSMAGAQGTQSHLLTTGNSYIQKMTQLLDNESAALEREKATLQTRINTEKQTLESEADGLDTEIQALEDQIKQKRTDAAQKRADAGQIVAKHAPKMQELDLRVAKGKAGLAASVQEMMQVLSIIQTAIQE
jgi:predicted  nucleic acid-binding Zn-ribbon protein